MLHFGRKKQQAIAAAEAKGASFWTTKFDAPFRVKLTYALKHAAGGDASTVTAAIVAAQTRLAGELGKYKLTDKAGVSPDEDFFTYLHTCPDEMVPSVIEALIMGLRAADGSTFVLVSIIGFKDDVRTLLDRHRIAWVLEEDEMHELKSKELHSGVIQPTLRLLAENKGLSAVEDAYRKALEKISAGEPESAITAAGTALQEMLRACGCNGNSIGDLVSDARKKGLLAPHDPKLASGIQSMIEWVGADRSEKGDSHKAGTRSKDDAWLTVHVVGALIVRLAAEKTR